MSEGSSRVYRQALSDIDITKPNVARVYDYFVGGKDNFSADREFARRGFEFADHGFHQRRMERVRDCQLVNSAALGAQLVRDGTYRLPVSGNHH